MKTKEVSWQALKPGDRCVMSFGIVTFQRAERCDRVQLFWREAQPAVTQSAAQTVTVIVEDDHAPTT